MATAHAPQRYRDYTTNKSKDSHPLGKRKQLRLASGSNAQQYMLMLQVEAKLVLLLWLYDSKNTIGIAAHALL